MRDLTIFVHVYYPGSWDLISAKCGKLLKEAKNVIVSACHNEVIDEIRKSDPAIIIQRVTNKGKDIGGKLAGLSYYYRFCDPTTYFAFLNDKISPQTLNAGYWFDKLYDIFSDEKLVKVSHLFQSKADVGAIGSGSFLKNEFSASKQSFDTTNNDLLQMLIAKYQLKLKRHDYIGGTIFFARSAAFAEFFRRVEPLSIRTTLEEGNVLDLDSGTYTHSWERMLCFIPQSGGYRVVGI